MEDLPGHGQRWEDHGPEGSFDEEAHEMDDFIEHDGDTTDAQFRAHRRALAKSARAQGISMEAAQELLEIFGQDAETRQRLELWEMANEVDIGDATQGEVEVRTWHGQCIDTAAMRQSFTSRATRAVSFGNEQLAHSKSRTFDDFGLGGSCTGAGRRARHHTNRRSHVNGAVPPHRKG